jgi:membrane protein DedA with SNARE-associated domain
MKLRVRNLLIITLLVIPILVISLSYLEDVAETSGQGNFEGLMSLVADMPRLVIGLVSQAGYEGVFALMLLEAAAFPVPSELILPLAGYLVYLGVLNFWLVVLWSTLAALVGSFADYYVGRKIGEAFLTGKSRLPFMNAAHLHRVDVWFTRYGSVAVTLLRLVPAARVLISFPAGIYRMNRSKFAICTLAGCLPWNMILIYLGWHLGPFWSEIVDAFRYVNILVYALLILLAVLIVRRSTEKVSARGHEGSLPLRNDCNYSMCGHVSD